MNKKYIVRLTAEEQKELENLVKRPYEPARPVLCMDEQPTQLIKETRMKIAAEPGKPQRVDYEYERNGTAANFMFTEPLGSWRKVNVRPASARRSPRFAGEAGLVETGHRRTSIDWAYEIKELLDKDYPHAQKVILVCDNLNTHKIASFYEVFEPKQARQLAERREIHYTPRHGSWLNVAEIELSVFTKQCLDRRIPDMETLQQEAKAWYRKRNAKQKSVDWQFTTEDARIKLKRLYPQIQML